MQCFFGFHTKFLRELPLVLSLTDSGRRKHTRDVHGPQELVPNFNFKEEVMSKRFDEYWKKNLTLIGILLAIWAFVSYGLGIFLVQPLNNIWLGGYPLGFWFAQQGSIYVFVILILVYCVLMNKMDRDYDVDEQ